MTSKKLKIAVTILFLNAAVCVGSVIALKRGISLPGVTGRSWVDVLPDVVFVSFFSLLAAYGMARRTTWGFTLGMLAAGAYIGASGSTVVRYVLERTDAGNTPIVSSALAPAVPYTSFYFLAFGIGLAAYLWSRRRVFAVGV